MCFDPVTLAAIGLTAEAATTASAVAGVAGAALSGYGAYTQAEGQAATAKANAEIARNNARQAEMAGQVEADRVRDRFRALQGSQTVAAAKSGVNPAIGSAGLLINDETEKNAFLDMSTTIWNAQSQGDAYRNRAAALDMEAKHTSKWAPISGAGSFLTGLGSTMRGVKLA